MIVVTIAIRSLTVTVAVGSLTVTVAVRSLTVMAAEASLTVTIAVGSLAVPITIGFSAIPITIRFSAITIGRFSTISTSIMTRTASVTTCLRIRIGILQALDQLGLLFFCQVTITSFRKVAKKNIHNTNPFQVSYAIS